MDGACPELLVPPLEASFPGGFLRACGCEAECAESEIEVSWLEFVIDEDWWNGEAPAWGWEEPSSPCREGTEAS